MCCSVLHKVAIFLSLTDASFQRRTDHLAVVTQDDHCLTEIVLIRNCFNIHFGVVGDEFRVLFRTTAKAEADSARAVCVCVRVWGGVKVARD